tara:strand:+ start:2462 stop:3133 length:672 start_codon:yes stop_codon:yes gene_type:complete
MRPNKHIRGNRRSGMTLVEIMIAMGIGTVLLGSLVSVTKSSQDAYQSSLRPLELETRARRAVADIVDELKGINVLSMWEEDPTSVFGVNRMKYRHVTGIDANGALVSGVENRLQWMRDPQELDDDIDNDGDGLIDEGRVVLTRDEGGPSERQVVLCHGVPELMEGELDNVADDNGNGMVDETGFMLRRENALVTVWITVEGIGGDGRLVQRSVETSVRLRNGL